jgi:hypothetical protein
MVYLVFQKQYAISLGKENQLPEKPAPIFIIGLAICSLIITITSALYYSQAIEFALIVGIGYLVANTVNTVINPNIPNPIHYGIISGAYHLVGILVVSIILFAMK